MVKPIVVNIRPVFDQDANTSTPVSIGFVLKIGGAIVLSIPVAENTYEKYMAMPNAIMDNDKNLYEKRSWHRECTLYIGDTNVSHVPNTFGRVIGWTRATFPSSTNDSLWRHITEEVDELGLALTNNTDPQGEIADIAILLMDMCAINGWNFDEIVQKKLEICKTREWEQPDAFGVTRHVK